MPDPSDQPGTDESQEERAPRFKLPELHPLREPKDLWPLPAILIGAALAVAGVLVLIRGAPGPDFEGALHHVESLIERQEYDRALITLNGAIREELEHPDATDEINSRFHAMRADALYLAQRLRLSEIGESQQAKNNNTILEEYALAESFDHHAITPRREAFKAQTLVDLGRYDEAVHHIERLAEEFAPRRHALLKRVISHDLVRGGAGTQRARELLTTLMRDRKLKEEDRLWAIARQTQLRLESGYAPEAIDALLPEIQRLEQRDTPGAAELFLMLGKAYLELGRFEAARDQLAITEQILPPGDERRGEAEALLARILQREGELEEARDRFSTVAERFPNSPAQVLAFLGLGEVEADLGRREESIAAYSKLVGRVIGEDHPALEQGSAYHGAADHEEAESDHGHADSAAHAPAQQVAMADVGVPIKTIDLSIAQRHRAQFIGGDLQTALRYSELIEALYVTSEPSPPAILRTAETHRAIARHEMGLGEDQDDADGLDVLRFDPIKAESIKSHFEAAGDKFREHSRLVVVDDPALAVASLWEAADAFDRSGDRDTAIELFTQFMQAMRSDPRRFEAKHRLARAFQAKGEHDTAIDLFEEIIQENPQSDEAYRSYVPLARSFVASGSEDGYEQAERWLTQVVSGRVFEPASPQFRAGLVEMARMYLAERRYDEAIARFDEVLERYENRSDRVRLEFELAEANRLSAGAIDRQLLDAMPLSDRNALETLREQRLRVALELYEDVRVAIEDIEPDRRSPMQTVILRNSTFFRGDCAFDLGEYDAAIRHYDGAAQRYAREPASLVAMVQIVNCYAELEKWREAQTAHERAQRRLRELPDDVWQTSAVPMDRRHWERWLEASHRLEQLGARADAADDAEP